MGGGGEPVLNGTRASVWGTQLWWVMMMVMVTTVEPSELLMCVFLEMVKGQSGCRHDSAGKLLASQ